MAAVCVCGGEWPPDADRALFRLWGCSLQAWPSSFSPQSPLSLDHVSQLVSCLRTYIRLPSRKQLTQDLLQLQSRLQEEGLNLGQAQGPLFTFQDSVSMLGI